MDEAQKRKHFRLEYPKSERPTLIIDGHKFEVIDVSEKGARFVPNKDFAPKLNAIYTGSIKFSDGTSFKIIGKVLRVDEKGQFAAMELSQGVPLTKMMEEHRKLLQKFKG